VPENLVIKVKAGRFTDSAYFPQVSLYQDFEKKVSFFLIEKVAWCPKETC
jgi:hypothetical protein